MQGHLELESTTLGIDKWEILWVWAVGGLCQLTLHRSIVSSETDGKAVEFAEPSKNKLVSRSWGRGSIKCAFEATRERNKWASVSWAARSDASVFPFPPSEDKTAKAEVQQVPDGSQQASDGSQQTADGTQLPSGHPSLASSQGTGSKCPFLAAEMSQGGSSVFRKASLALQEDVQEMHAVREGKLPGTLTRVKRSFSFSRPSDLSALLRGEYFWPYLPL